MRLIDADSLYKGIEQQKCNACESYNNDKCAACDIADCLRWIDDAPTVEAKPVKHGRWDVHDVVKILSSGKTLDGFCQCENCGIIMPYHYSEYDFCPNCGARMGGD
ncbi:MAG: hypothetical protein K6C68_13010 [Ruminococcus sp.]|nr:hypothetical protein [Ruminococcus sp.]